MFSSSLGDDMYHGDEQYKYLTNEGDLNNAHDDSIALTPKTPKKDDAKLAVASPLTPQLTTAAQTATPQTEASKHPLLVDSSETTTPKKELISSALNSVSNNNLNVAVAGKKVIAGSVGNMSMAESMDGSFYRGYDSSKNLNADNIPIEARPKHAG